jgi:hypothetical protein
MIKKIMILVTQKEQLLPVGMKSLTMYRTHRHRTNPPTHTLYPFPQEVVVWVHRPSQEGPTGGLGLLLGADSGLGPRQGVVSTRTHFKPRTHRTDPLKRLRHTMFLRWWMRHPWVRWRQKRDSYYTVLYCILKCPVLYAALHCTAVQRSVVYSLYCTVQYDAQCV